MTEIVRDKAKFQAALTHCVDAFHAAGSPQEAADQVVLLNKWVQANQDTELCTSERLGVIERQLSPKTDVEVQGMLFAKAKLGMAGFGSP